MKTYLLLLLLLHAITVFSQSTTYAVTLQGISGLTLGMNKEAAEALLKQKISLNHLLKKNDGQRDTINVTYHNINLSLYFDKRYNESDECEYFISGICSEDATVITPSGISVGDCKSKVINTYDDYNLSIAPDYDVTNGAKSKTKSSICLHDDDGGSVLIFHLANNKVKAIEVAYAEKND
jgi:hypothetical protein